MRRRVLCLSVLLFAPWVSVQAQRLPIKIYTTADGLAHNDVRRIVKDSRGFLWFCTAEGLSRFDGYEFTNFGTDQGLPDGSVNALLETRGGEYWVATDGGLARFDPRGRPMFTVVLPDDEDRRARVITALVEGRDGTIWSGTNRGLYRLDNSSGRRALRIVEIGMPNESPSQRQIFDVLEDAQGSLWIATASGLYRRWPDGNAARYTARDGLPSETVHDLLEDHEGRLWVGTRTGGFYRLRTDATRRAPVIDLAFRQAQGLPTDWVFQLFETADRRFWAATSRGLAEFFATGDAQDRRVRSYGRSNGLTYHDITALSEDLGGNLWLGTNTAGAMKLARDGFSTYGAQDFIQQVNTIFEDRGGDVCFMGAVFGDARTSVFEGATLDPLKTNEAPFHTRLGCFDGQRFHWFKPDVVTSFGWAAERVVLQARNGDWWVSAGNGLYRFPPARRFSELKTARPLAVFTTDDGLAALPVFRLFEDSRRNVWVSTIGVNTNGLARWEPESGRMRDLANSAGLPSLPDDLPRSFGEDLSGNVWIGFNGGLARYAQGVFRFFTANDGLPQGSILDIHVDQSGRTWLATARGGLIRVDGGMTERPTFVSYTTAQGLSSNRLEVITEDARGYLYVGGGNGLDRFDPATGRVKHFGAAEGLTPGILRAAFRDSHGVLWFGTSSGLARFAPAAERAPAPPLVLISGLRVTGVPQPVSALGEREMSLPAFAPDQNQLEIDFVALGFGPGEVLRYQYRLDGSGTDWSALSEQRSVTYASLSPGRYRFLVRAVNSDGIASADPATLTFTILSPLWLRWWFLSLAALALSLTVYSLHRYRVARVLEMANLRTRIATDLHDDIGADLTRIALLSEVAKQTRDNGPLVSIARIARESVSAMSDIVWAINPKRESLADLIRRMRQHAEEVFTLRDIELAFRAPDAGDDLKLGVDVRRDLLLVFKEVVNNAARHSRCTRVAIDLRRDGSRLVLEVVDNGIGFDASTESDGQGLASMQRRAARLKGALEIASGQGGGTTVTLTISA